ncbi:MAG: ATP-binding protein [Prevotellaceae bacterium]|jgi:predicted AAA+ superfamily ATPase|nr:ATP-binding protein [Prevotellaceae bacterium]
MYIKRHIDNDLLSWKNTPDRKPLLLRGARQVGKSFSVRELGKSFDNFVEINFEHKNFQAAKEIFLKHSSPKLICNELSAVFGVKISAGQTLLFLDEIQNCIPAISSLRYFYEEMPELHVAAAGSLLEFALQQIPSFGVGRIRSLFMYPLSFDEFLRAMNFDLLADKMQNATPETEFSEAMHKKCVEHLRYFLLIGGMPEVVAAYAQGGSLLDCQQILDDLTNTFYDDFAKYKEKVQISRLREVFNAVVMQTGKKFVLSNVQQLHNLQIKESLELLEMAGLIYSVTHTAANGLPLGAEVNAKYRKFMLFDTGIYQRHLRLDLAQILNADNFDNISKGALAELFAANELKKAAPSNFPNELYYWRREKDGSSAEVDFVVQQGENIVPVEVKSGTKGSMQSLFLFLKEKNCKYGIRSSLENFGKFDNIMIYPLYSIGNILK